MASKKRMLKDVGDYKTEMISLFLNNKDFCDLMLMNKDYTEENIDNLVYSQVFPYLYSDETQKEVLPYVCIETLPIRANGTIKKMKCMLWVYANKKCMNVSMLGYSGTRVDMICDIIEQIIRNLYLGVGKVEFDFSRIIFPNSKFYGKEFIFTVPDFQLKDINKDN